MAPRTIDPELLRAFVTVVDCGGFSAAARRLLRGQSAVSLQLKRLEEQLGIVLLERTSRRIALTAEGELVLGQARQLLELNERLLDRAREPDLAGLVRIGAPEDFATSHLPRILSNFRRSHPRIALEVICELTLELQARFDRGEVDMALLKQEPSVMPGGTRVWREKLVWVGGAENRQLAGERPLPLVCSPNPCVYRARAIGALDAAAIPWRIAYNCGSLAGNHAAVRAGLGIAVLPRDMVPADLVLLDAGWADMDLPELADTQITLVTRPDLNVPMQRLSDYIVHELELGWRGGTAR